MANSYLNLKNFIKIGEQKGSNPGGVYQEKTTGVLFYLKFPGELYQEYGNDIAKNEVLAAKLYELAEVKVPEVSLIKDQNGNLGVASKIEPTFESVHSLRHNNINWSKLLGIQEGFAVDAWLSNWDVVGEGYSNIGRYKNPTTNQWEAFRIDTGGALIFRARGKPKYDKFGKIITEIDGLQDKAINKPAAIIFSPVAKEKLKEGILRINKISNNDIKELVDEYGQGTIQEKQELFNIIIARKENLNVQLYKEIAFKFLRAYHIKRSYSITEKIIKINPQKVSKDNLKKLKDQLRQGIGLSEEEKKLLRELRREQNKNFDPYLTPQEVDLFAFILNNFKWTLKHVTNSYEEITKTNHLLSLEERKRLKEEIPEERSIVYHYTGSGDNVFFTFGSPDHYTIESGVNAHSHEIIISLKPESTAILKGICTVHDTRVNPC